MKYTHINHLLSGFESLMISEGDKKMLENFRESLVDMPIEMVHQFIRCPDIGEELEIDEKPSYDADSEEYITLEQHDKLHFKGDEITKELWLDTIMPEFNKRAYSLEKEFRLTIDDLQNIDPSHLRIIIERELCRAAEDISYTLKMCGDGEIVLYRYSGYVGLPEVALPELYNSKKIVEKILNALQSIDFLSLQYEHYERLFKIDDFAIELQEPETYYDDVQDIAITIEVSDKFKLLHNHRGANWGIGCFESYLDDLVYNKIKRYARKPRLCKFCKSTKIAPILYGEPMEHIMKEAEEGKVIIGGCCLRGDDPMWGCVDCGMEFYKI